MNDTRVQLRWLKAATPIPAGLTWGMPWKEGELSRDERLSLHMEGGTAPALQSWPTAYWPDGSVKWTAHAAAFPAGAPDGCAVVKAEPGLLPTSASLSVHETENDFTIDTGVISFRVPKTGSRMIADVQHNGISISSYGELIAIKESVSELTGSRTIRQVRYQSRIYEAKLEQAGPVRAVIKLTGRHRAVNGTGEWLPFSLRLYAYAGLESLRIVHTFFYDGNPNQDFVKGLGIRFGLPMRGPLYNRHVRFAGDSGFVSESPKTLHTRRTHGKYLELFKRQLNGELLPDEDMADEYFMNLLDDSACWDGYKMAQLSADHYLMAKRTKAGCGWLKSAEGRRGRGVAYVGGPGGGLALAMRNFWQKHPSGMEAHGLTADEAQLTAWFWSPEAPAMDMRHYDTSTHVESSYEGAEELRATPYGVGNTSELTIWCRGRRRRRLSWKPTRVITIRRRCLYASRLIYGAGALLASGACRTGERP